MYTGKFVFQFFFPLFPLPECGCVSAQNSLSTPNILSIYIYNTYIARAKKCGHDWSFSESENHFTKQEKIDEFRMIEDSY
jgi:hypothetical protein